VHSQPNLFQKQVNPANLLKTAKGEKNGFLTRFARGTEITEENKNELKDLNHLFFRPTSLDIT
jgi:hypothetical protein